MVFSIQPRQALLALDLKAEDARDACSARRDGRRAALQHPAAAMAAWSSAYEASSHESQGGLCRRSGFGRRGPIRPSRLRRLIQAATGMPCLLSCRGPPSRAMCRRRRRPLGRPAGRERVSAALYYRERPAGPALDVPMFEHLLQMILGDHLAAIPSSRRTARRVHPHPLARPPSL